MLPDGHTEAEASPNRDEKSAAPPGPGATTATPGGRLDGLAEVAGGWALAAGLALLAWRWLGPTLGPYGAALAWGGTGAFLAARARGGLAGSGLALARPLRSLGLAALYAALVLPVFAAGFLVLNARGGYASPGALPFVAATLNAFFFAALPEEIFFRGFVQTRLGTILPPGRRRPLPLVPVTWASIAAAAAFAATHVVFEPHPARLLTFFPGLLFGALREESGDVAAPAVFHALCNGALYGLWVGVGLAE